MRRTGLWSSEGYVAGSWRAGGLSSRIVSRLELANDEILKAGLIAIKSAACAWWGCEGEGEREGAGGQALRLPGDKRLRYENEYKLQRKLRRHKTQKQ